MILVILAAPERPLRRAGASPRRSAYEPRAPRRARRRSPGRVLLVVAVAALGSQLNPVRQLEFGEALVSVAIVVAIYVFVGNSGVLSFGHISFVAVGAYLSGILTLDVEQKNLILPTMFGVLRHTHTDTALSLAIAAAAGGALRADRRDPADAALRAAGRHRDLRGARHHHEHHQLLGQDRAGRDGARAGARRTASGR